jgi:hypothetical protein
MKRSALVYALCWLADRLDWLLARVERAIDYVRTR